MPMSWDEMKEHAEDRQRSGGVIERTLDYPFAQMHLDIKNEQGNLIGTLVVEELIPTVPTPFVERSIRLGISWDIRERPQKPATSILPSDGAFPDEDA